jgi:predicted acetyltransferase
VLTSIRDVKYSKQDRQWIQDVYGEYLESLSSLNTGLFTVLGVDDPVEHHREEIFANWFSNDQSHPLVILQGAKSVGFALVTRPRIAPAGERSADFVMSEFFVREPHRRAGVGRDAATLIFDRFAGEWEILEYTRNPGAVAFWRRVISAYSRGSYTERSRNDEIRQRFRSRSRP